jgi:hypothetical protein
MWALLPMRAAPRQILKGTIHVKVFQASGDLVPGVAIEVAKGTKYNDGSLILMRSSEKSEEEAPGEYRITVDPGEYYVRTGNTSAVHVRTYFPNTSNPEQAQAISVGPGAQVSVDIHLSQDPVFTITGRIIDLVSDPHPHYISAVSLESTNFKVREYRLYNPFSGYPVCCSVEQIADLGISVTTSGDRFEIRGVRAGEYELIGGISVGDVKPGDLILFKPGERPPYSRSFQNRVLVSVSDKDISNIQIEITPGADLKGRIVSTGKSVQTQMTNIELRRILGHNSLQYAPVGKDGRFEFDNLLDGDYSISVGILPGSAYVGDIFQGERLIPGGRGLWLLANTANVKIVVGKAKAEPLRIVVNPNGGSINGKLDRAQEASIFLFAEEPSMINASRWQASNPAGEFKMSGIVPGRYRMYALANKASQNVKLYFPSYFPEQIKSQGTPIVVKPGDRLTVRPNLIDFE